MVPLAIAQRFELTIPVADWGSEKNYAHPLQVGLGQQTQPALAGTAVPESVMVVDTNGDHHPELSSVVAVVNPGVAPGYVRLKAQGNAALYAGLGVTAVAYKVRLYVQIRHTTLGLIVQPADPTPLSSPMWALGGGPPPSPTVTNETSWGITPAVGASGTYADGDHTHGSPQYPMAGLPWTSSGGVNPLHRFFDHFIGGAPDEPWVVVPGGAVLPVFDHTVKGVVKFPGDNAPWAASIWFGKSNYYRAASPLLETRCRTTAITVDQRIVFTRYTGAACQWGIQYNPALSPNWGIFSKNGAGADVFTPSKTPVVSDQWYVLRVWLSGAVGAQTINLTIDGADLTQYSTQQPDPDLGCPWVYCDIGGGAGTGLYIDWIGVEADFSQTPA